MALVNYATREISAKIVYYGPGLSGKTTNIHHVFSKVQPKNKGKLISLSTQGDRTLFFDFLPVELGNIKGFRTRFHLYTVPGQVFYNSTRKLVLKGADGVVFVADSQKMMMDENIQSLENLKTNLSDMGIDFDNFPVVIQYNKQDLPNAASVEEMDRYLNPMARPNFAAAAITGDGVLKTLTAIVKFILHDLKEAPSGHSVDFEALGMEETQVLPAEAQEEEPEAVAVAEPEPVPEPVVAAAVEEEAEISEAEIPEPEMPRIILTPNRVSILSPEPPVLEEPPVYEEPPVQEAEEVVPAIFHEDEPEDTFSSEEKAFFSSIVSEARGRDLEPGPAARQTFMLPVRISTLDGLKEITLKVSVDIEIAGEGVRSIDKVEVLQPAPPDVSKLKPPDPARPERPKQAPVPISKPKVQEKKLSMFHKILGMK